MPERPDSVKPHGFREACNCTSAPPPSVSSETIKENTVEHTIEMYDSLACCACGWSGFPDEVAAHQTSADD